jgi:hypothetical protein
MSTLAPRVVVVHRRSELDELLATHGTPGAAGYFLRRRGRDLDEVVARHEALAAARVTVGAAVPPDWRRGEISRDDLPHFLFDPQDVVVAVGQDGLVANVAKYLDGQPVIGVDPEPGRNAGVLVRFGADRLATLLARVVSGDAAVQQRTMVTATLDDGQRLTGLNEVYLGHPSHQSSRYQLATWDGRRERHSSSGLIVGTGTGATGWCASIARERATAPAAPDPVQPRLCWYVREAWASPATGASLTSGLLDPGQALEVSSEGEHMVVFADGVEQDRLVLSWGQRVSVGLATRTLRLVVPG